MTRSKLNTLTKEKRTKVLKVLERDALFDLNNCRMSLSDWKKHYEVYKLLKEYDYSKSALEVALLNVEVATRTEEEDIILLNLRNEIKPQEVIKLIKNK